MPDSIETKLAAARTRLILDQPFLGALVLRLPMQAADSKWCRTCATDARSFYYNPDYIDALSLAQVQFVLAHEALHCALSHFARRQHRIKRRWDLACDFAINPLLLKDGLRPPPGVMVEERFEGMTAEEIYPSIDESTADAPMDQHLYDREDQPSDGSGSNAREGDRASKARAGEEGDSGGSQQRPQLAEAQGGPGGTPEPKPLSTAEQEQLKVQWQQRLAGAAQSALQAGKLGGAMARMVDHLLQPQLPWRMLLARYVTAVGRDDYSYTRPSKREGSAILPRLRSGQVSVVVAVDTSGSVGDAEIGEFLAEVNAIKGQIRARLTLLPCDARLAPGAPWIYEPWEECVLPERLPRGGGTSFRPVFDWVEHNDPRPDLLVYFTDAQGEFPRGEPPFPILWLVKGKAKVPWGQRIQLN